MDIFIKCGICEESGHGVPQVVGIYGESAYEFSNHFIDVTIPFDKNGFENNAAKNNTENFTENFTEKELSVFNIIKNNSRITTTELASTIGVSRQTINNILNKLKQRGVINRVGPDKGGHLEVK